MTWRVIFFSAMPLLSLSEKKAIFQNIQFVHTRQAQNRSYRLYCISTGSIFQIMFDQKFLKIPEIHAQILYILFRFRFPPCKLLPNMRTI